MGDVRGSSADNERRPSEENVKLVVEHMNEMSIDLSWLEDQDFDLIEDIKSFIMYEALKLELTEDRLYKSAEDLLAYAEGVANSISGILALYRNKHEEEESAFTVMYFMASLAYQHGVRDASEGRLTQETIDNIVKQRAKADERRAAMNDLYDDIRGE